MSNRFDHDTDLSPEERDVLARLGGLPREARPARDLWPMVAARIAADQGFAPLPRRRRLGRVLTQIAAALVIFAAGVLAGRQWDARPATEPVPTLAQASPLAAAAEVQRAGTEYVAALASLRRLEGAGHSLAKEQGCEAAMSTLYGAAHELTKLSPDDQGARQILQTVAVTRSTAQPAGPAPTVRF